MSAAATVARIATFMSQSPLGLYLMPSWPGLSRPSTTLRRGIKKDLDGRNKSGHDVRDKSRAGQIASAIRRRGLASGNRGDDYVSTHPLNPLSPRRARFERITEVLGFAGHLAVFELHDAHGVRELPVIGEDEFSNPEVGSAEYPAHRETFLVRLRGTRCLNVVPAADALPRSPAQIHASRCNAHARGLPLWLPGAP